LEAGALHFRESQRIERRNLIDPFDDPKDGFFAVECWNN